MIDPSEGIFNDIIIDQLTDNLGECEAGTLYQTPLEWDLIWFDLHVWGLKVCIRATMEALDAN